jgi:hypothetical protein
MEIAKDYFKEDLVKGNNVIQVSKEGGKLTTTGIAGEITEIVPVCGGSYPYIRINNYPQLFPSAEFTTKERFEKYQEETGKG